MTIEEYLIDQLDLLLSVPVSGDVPHPMPAEFVTVEKTGSYLTNILNGATIAIQSWSTSRAAAAALNQLVIGAMLVVESLPEIGRCQLSTDYNYTDTATNRPRYQAVYEIIYYESEDTDNA